MPSFPTLDDVARAAYCSPASVSRVINNRPGVAPEMRRRVRVAINSLGYKVSTTGGVIGVMVPDRSNPFFGSLGPLFQDRLEAHGLQVRLVSSEGAPTRELDIINSSVAGLRGIIYIATDTPGTDVLKALGQSDLPVVTFDRGADQSYDSVSVDNTDGILRAVDHLTAHGHTKIGHLAGPINTQTGSERREAFVRALEINGLQLREQWIWDGDYSPQAGLACGESLIDLEPTRRPTALVCANDLMALGALQTVQLAGWSVPRQLSIIGFDDIEAAALAYPPLTSVSQRVRALIEAATEMLIRQLVEANSPDREPRAIRVKPRLIPRGTVAPPNTTNQVSQQEISE